ncbi:MAG: site-specific integrase, partial [Candidatus Latescibacterota bacterium]
MSIEHLPVGRRAPELSATDPLQQFLAGQLKESTRRAYGADVRLFLHFLGLERPEPSDLATVQFQDVVAFRNHLARQGYERASINRKLSSLKAFFRMMVAAGIVVSNPADSSLVRGYRVDTAVSGKAIASAALQQILQVIEQEEDDLVRARDRALFYLLTYGGLRRS